MCYDDSDELYAQIFDTGLKAREGALEALGFIRDGAIPVAINTLPWDRSEVVKLPKGIATTGSSHAPMSGGPGVIPQSKANFRVSKVSVNEIKPGVFRLDNGKLRLDVQNGIIKSLYDVDADREVIAPGGKAGQLVIFDDKPLYWQAWDVEVFHLESRKELQSGKTSIAEQDAYRVSVGTETKISENSWVKTTISLAAASEGKLSHVEFESEVEWQETMKFLKVEFPVDITNTEASYETQYGIIKRPTHYNTRYAFLSSTLSPYTY